MQPLEKVEFPGSSGRTLRGVIHHGIGERQVYAVYAHCFTCTKDLPVAARIAERLRSLGITTLRFDFAGLGESDGDFADSTFTSNLDDLRAAYRALSERYAPAQLLIGHSLGGAAVLATAGEFEAVKGVVTIGAPASPEHLKGLFGFYAEEIARDGEAEVELAGRAFTIRKEFLEDLGEHRMRSAIQKLQAALLVMHSPIDATVGVENARAIFEAARHPKSFISLDEADHLLKRRVDAEYVANLLSAWLQRYVAPAEHSRPAKGVVVVEGGGAPFLQHVHAGRHELVGDEPAQVGGEDLGPTPYDYLLTALGTCSSMTMQMYAQRKQWPLEGVEVRLEHRREYRKDCEDCTEAERRIEVLRKKIRLRGPLTEEQRARVLAIAERCPVHRTLLGNLRIDTELEE